MDAWVVFGPDNFTYLTGVALPFANEEHYRQTVAIQTPQGRGTVICPLEWAGAIADQGWTGALHVYDEEMAVPPQGCVDAVAGILTMMGLTAGRIGLDLARTPAPVAALLREKLPQVKWLAVDDELQSLRMVKTASEVALLETAAQHSQKGFVSALNHSEATVDLISYTLAEFTERIRVHVGEFGGSATGQVVALQGADMRYLHMTPRWQPPAGQAAPHGGDQPPPRLLVHGRTHRGGGRAVGGPGAGLSGQPVPQVPGA